MRRLRCISAARSRDHCMYHGSSSAACSGGNTVAVFVPRVVLWSWLLHCVGFTVVAVALRGFHSRGRCTAWVSRSWPLCRVGVAVAVFVPHVVLWSWSFHHM